MKTYDFIKQVLGLDLEGKDLMFLSIALRGLIVFFATLIMVRLADRRFMAKLSAFDTILTLILASMLARAVNGSASFFPTLAGGFILVGLHRLLGALSFHWEWLGILTKGRPVELVANGRVKKPALAATKITESDLLEEARLNGQIASIADIGLATMERNGQVSTLPLGKK